MDYSLKSQQKTLQLMEKMQLSDGFEKTIQSTYLPLSKIILDNKQQEPLIISINGAQGTGKSTLGTFIKHLIESNTNLSVAAISLDDFYLTRAERKKLSKDVHPLLLTRGVPGTHDIELLANTLSALSDHNACSVPHFDKSIDDRLSIEYWTQHNTNQHKPIDIVLFEGWCNNSPYQTEEELLSPINELEEKEDSNGIWRNYANEKLKIYHQKIFCYSDMNIMLKAPNFEQIFEWRNLQERKLKDSTAYNKQSKIMSPTELNRFIQHYERITRHTLKHLPSSVDIVIPLSNDHSIENIIKNNT